VRLVAQWKRPQSGVWYPRVKLAEAANGLLRTLHRGPIDAIDLIRQLIIRQGNAIGIKGIGANNLGPASK